MSAAYADDLAPRAQTVHRLGASLGFAMIGIAPARSSPYQEHLRRWLAEGKHGEMSYLAADVETRVDPAALVPGATFVICVADLYAPTGAGRGSEVQTTHIPDHGSDQVLTPAGRIARYAHGDDYHRVMKKRLHELADALRARWPDHTFRTTVDTAPTLDREHAHRAGLGWIGKHTLLIHPRLGSFFFLGEIITTLPLQPSDSPPKIVADHCGSCTRCIDACPTGCITPYSVDGSRCVSYLTLEHRGKIATDLQEAMGDWIAGCDICQEVCPYNQAASNTARDLPAGMAGQTDRLAQQTPHPAYTPRRVSLPLLEVLNWSSEDRQQAFERSALKRLKLDQLKRNALIAAGNHLLKQDHAPLRSKIAAFVVDENESDLVRYTATQTLSRIS